MNRTVFLNSYSFEIAREQARQLSGYQLITPNPRAARSLARSGISLAELAAQLVVRVGGKIASPLACQRALLAAIATIEPMINSEMLAPSLSGSIIPAQLELRHANLARALTATLPRLLRAGIDLAALANSAPPRARRVARFARQYLDNLSRANLIEPEQLLWQAAELAEKAPDSSRERLLVYGYPRLGHDEAKFLDAIAAEGSILLLAQQREPIFLDNQPILDFLARQNWQIETESRNLSLTIGEKLSQRLIAPKPPSDNGRNVIGQPIELLINDEAAEKELIEKELTGKELTGKDLIGKDLIGKDLGANVGEVRGYFFANLEDEVRAALGAVKSLLAAGVGSNEIVLAVRNEALYVPIVVAVAWEYELPIKVFYQLPLAQSKLGSWLQLLFRVIEEEFPFESTARFLNHPFSPGLSDKQWQEARRRYWHGLTAWQRATKLDLTDLIWPQQDTRASWLARLNTLLTTRISRELLTRWPRELLALELLQQSLADTGAFDNADSKVESAIIGRAQFIQQIVAALAILNVPIQPEPGGVELHLPIMISGARYRHVFILGVAEQILPEPIQDDLMLDFYERKQLLKEGFAFESAAELARRELLAFAMLLQTATETLTLSYPKLIGDRETLPSALFKSLGITATAPGDHRVASIEEARRSYLRRALTIEPLSDDPVLVVARLAWQVERARELSPDYSEFDGLVGAPLELNNWVFSASQLTALGQCPFKWLARYILKIDEIEETDIELSPTMLGSLYHKTLELALGWVKGASGDLRQALLERLEEALLEAEQLEGLAGVAGRSAHRHEDLQRLRQAVLGSDFLPIDGEVLGLETRFSSSWNGLNIVGDLDRVDITPDGLVLIDYKTSASAPLGAKTSDGRARLDVQLPLYIQAAADTLFPGEKVADAYYYSLTKARVLKRAKVDEAALQELVTRVKNHLSEGQYPVSPDINQEACNYCSFDLVCRRGPRLSRKRRPA